MRILITGAEGQLGRALTGALQSHDVVPCSHGALDVSDEQAVLDQVTRAHPAVVIHTAAMTDTARCEADPDAANDVNAVGARNVARACASVEARFLAISTNEVFDGVENTPYTEQHEPNPANAYGRSKLEGEQLARRAHPNSLIVRTSWLYGDGERNFVTKVLTAAQARRPLRFVTDEVATPTSTADLAEAIRRLMEARAAPGIYHLTNEGEASRHEWAREILRLAGMSEATIEPVTTAQLRASGYNGPPKPPYSVLANTRARALGITLPAWRDALAAHFRRMANAMEQPTQA